MVFFGSRLPSREPGRTNGSAPAWAPSPGFESEYRPR